MFRLCAPCHRALFRSSAILNKRVGMRVSSLPRARLFDLPSSTELTKCRQDVLALTGHVLQDFRLLQVSCLKRTEYVLLELADCYLSGGS